MRVGDRARVEVEGWEGVEDRRVVQVQRQATVESEIQSPFLQTFIIIFLARIRPEPRILSVSSVWSPSSANKIFLV